MNIIEAWEIVESTEMEAVSEEDEFLYEEALNCILNEALEASKGKADGMWGVDVQAGAYNLAAYYEYIGKYDLAIKYYNLSLEYGGSLAKERIGLIKEYYF